MAFLFDTDAVSELFRKQPASSYLSWIATIPRADQFISAVSIGELYRGAFRSENAERHVNNIEDRVLKTLTVLPLDVAVARLYGQLYADLTLRGLPLTDADLQIAATAIHHGLELVTGNVRHFERIPGINLSRVLADARQRTKEV
jgi:predicted nucleic acid-binding protein